MFTTLLCVAVSLPLQTAGDLAPQVRSLVRELDAPQKAARDVAERRLIALGPDALEVLPEPRPADSAEVALRLNRVRMALLRAKTARSLAGSRVTMHAHDAPLAEVLAALEKQTGNKVVDYRRQFGQRSDDLRVTLDVADVSFWQAVDKLNAAAGLTPYLFAGEDGLALVARGGDERLAAESPRHVQYVGAFRVKARRLTLAGNLDAAAEMQIELEAAWEPRLKPLFLTVAAANMEITDDAGRPLAPANPNLVLEVPPQGRASQVNVTFSVAAPPRESKTVARLAGAIDVLIPAEPHTFRFGNLADATHQEQRAAAATVALEPTRVSNGVLEVPVRVRYENPANALESHRAWFYKNPAYLESADGRKAMPTATELVRQADNELQLKMTFADPGDLATQTFVYQTPADIVSLPVEFEFTNLPLP